MRNPFVCVGNFKLIKTIPAKRFDENKFNFRQAYGPKGCLNFNEKFLFHLLIAVTYRLQAQSDELNFWRFAVLIQNRAKLCT